MFRRRRPYRAQADEKRWFKIISARMRLLADRSRGKRFWDAQSYLKCGSQIHTSSAASAIITANKPASTNATLQPTFIAGVAALTVLVTAERKAPSSRAGFRVACPTKLMVMGAFPFSYFETHSASEISVNSSVESRRGLLDPIFHFASWSLPHINSIVKPTRFYKCGIMDIGDARGLERCSHPVGGLSVLGP
jgi:hypothetical protein